MPKVQALQTCSTKDKTVNLIPAARKKKKIENIFLGLINNIFLEHAKILNEILKWDSTQFIQDPDDSGIIMRTGISFHSSHYDSD